MSAKIVEGEASESSDDEFMSTGDKDDDQVPFCTCNESIFRGRSEEHTSELQSRPHISYAVFCLKKKKKKKYKHEYHHALQN